MRTVAPTPRQDQADYLRRRCAPAQAQFCATNRCVFAAIRFAQLASIWFRPSHPPHAQALAQSRIFSKAPQALASVASVRQTQCPQIYSPQGCAFDHHGVIQFLEARTQCFDMDSMRCPARSWHQMEAPQTIPTDLRCPSRQHADQISHARQILTQDTCQHRQSQTWRFDRGSNGAHPKARSEANLENRTVRRGNQWPLPYA